VDPSDAPVIAADGRPDDRPFSGDPTPSGAPAPDPVAAQPGDTTQDRLVQAAAEVFSEKGYRGAGVQEIARRAGLTTGAIYSRYSGKAELLAEAIRAESGRQLDELFAAGEGPLGAAEMIRRAGTALPQRTGGRKQFLLLEAFVAARQDPEVAEVLDEHVAGVRARFQRVLEVGRRSRDLDPTVDPEALVHFCQAVAWGFLLYEALGTAAPRPEAWREVIDRTVDAFRPPTADTDHPERGAQASPPPSTQGVAP
jgi:TetR/AcrR family transcriptional regulator, repressor for uid operon